MSARAPRVAAAWLAEGRRVVAATLVEALGSSPLETGAAMLVDDRGRIEGSVAGGCVEGALVERAQAVLAGAPPEVASYGVSDEQAADVGLSCGGTIRVLVHELVDAAPVTAVADALERERPVALATLVDGAPAGAQLAVLDDAVVGTLGVGALLDDTVAREARGYVDEGRSALRRYSARGETMGAELRVAISAFAAPPAMVIVGAIDFSAELARLARAIGYRVTIVDPRRAFVAAPRFAEHASVAVAWPQEHLRGLDLGPRDAVLVFTHDPKLDEPALLAALETRAGYVGALGSRRTQAQRDRRLRAAGADDAALARIHGPCGLDVGARTPAETAIAVLAEILAVRSGRSGGRLADGSGPIHPRAGQLAAP